MSRVRMRSVSMHIPYLACISWIFLSTLSLPAQISSVTADFSDTLEYPVFPARDPFFIFHTAFPGAPDRGTLTAAAPGGTPGYDFSWSRYNPASNDFDPPFFTESGVMTSKVGDLGRGCYRVHISSADLDTVLRAWVFPNDPEVRVVNKGEDDKLLPAWGYTCDRIILEGMIRPEEMTYYDLTTGRDTSLANGMSFEWTCDDSEYQIFGGSLFQTLTIYNEPPYSRPPTQDTWFFLTAVDSFGFTRMDEVLYESVHVKAGFTMWFEDRSSSEDGEGTWTESNNPEEESPMEVRFLNTSENGAEFVWTLVDSAKTGEDSKLTTYDVNDSVVYTYYIPGYYYPSMVAYSEAGCVDSFPLGTNLEIHVLPSELDAPNVFTPNGDGVNDYFVVRAKSLKTFRITIYDRGGGKVYEYEHSDGRFEWEGWDGTYMGKGNHFVSPGVYYYVIDALGWDATVYRNAEPYKGFVYIFREAE